MPRETTAVFNRKARRSLVRHSLPLRAGAAREFFRWGLAILFLPAAGLGLIFIFLLAPGKWVRNAYVGPCPVCETPLAVNERATAFTCPECKSRSIRIADRFKCI